jgi:CBS domain-containing protein
VNSTRIHQGMNTRPTVINTATGVRDAARLITNAHFRHLPVASDADLVDGDSPVAAAVHTICSSRRASQPRTTRPRLATGTARW